jgi:hypothetical protein
LPPVRRRRRGRGWLILLAVLVVLLIAADRIGVAVADRVVASKIQQSQHLTSTPSVSIEGIPFLTQAIANDYHSIRLSGRDVTVGAGGDQVRLDSFRGRLTGVKTFDHFHGVTAERGTGTAVLGYAELSRLLGVPLSYGTGGRVQATRSVDVLGKTVTGTVSAVVTVPGGDQLAFSDVRVAVEDVGVGIPSLVTSQLSSIFARKLSLGGLPFGLQVTQLTVSRSGIEVSAVAANIRLGS